ncbi:hypothetical protein [Leifsonia aquatica]|uniref:hypothetical protein n=1 Tax=Leifsonia aquatica TaxID=144185 RepID=UPI000468A0C6|nr:hypothetical protein [Leifsonia aquatica]
MSTKTRRLTRRINLNLPPERWPVNHNRLVAERKRKHRTPIAAPRIPTIAAAFHALTDGALDAARSATHLVAAFNTAAERMEIAREFRILDNLAARGFDVRTEHDALAAREAALNAPELEESR